MDALSYIKRAAGYASLAKTGFAEQASITLVTNFTDDILQKLLIGLSLEENIYPTVFADPYKQYHFDLKNTASALYGADADITYFVFDVSPYLASEFTSDASHLASVVSDIGSYAAQAKGHVVVASFPAPLESAYGNLIEEDPLSIRVKEANEKLTALSKEHANLSIVDTGRLVARTGEARARDMRTAYAFDVPFTNDFTLTLARELVSYLFAIRGKAKKCIVVDLDNTLWGGIVGEIGPGALELGTGYPGLAYQNFQRTLLSFNERGVLLAIASRNNPADVDEVFRTNLHMVLKKEHFSSMHVNWETKSANITAIAKDLNIGLDSIVFLDDDAANREEVRSMLPTVLVPDFPALPETYPSFTLGLTCFNQITLTEEDRKKGELYRAERARKEVITGGNPDEYLAKLKIEISVRENDPKDLARAAQLSQKTNQFNLTTKRYTEADIKRLTEDGASVFTAEVSDSFGHYGIVALLIATPTGKDIAVIDTMLMSCRVFARGVEYAFMDHVIEKLSGRGYRTLMASYQATPKNEPARGFLPKAGFVPEGADYRLDTETYKKEKPPEIARILPLLALTCQN